ncbi:hypothetical protein GCM10023194_70610 [Planotetraspora phitsanulokensis]|uniref:Uncharacterized protein n=1 Tax=Planotetraspora phitsanulokensis TaxID=575192 RepID=A0A8J3UEZ1_9ACTN|nr:hypothetical protein [Planotetraspora phitsanulokensis]GII43256.1 hypothetical protein Pph01_82590 [Planotetraspora phitsanulokensis]
MRRIRWRDWLEAVAALLTVTGLILPIAILVAVSAGLWESKDPLQDIRHVLELVSGAVSGFMLAAGIALFNLRRQSMANGRSTAEVEKSVQALQAMVFPEVDGVLKRREAMPGWPMTLRGGRRLSLSGMSLRAFSLENLGNVEHILEAGGSCRVLMIKPGSESSAVAALNFLNDTDPSEYDRDVRQSLDRFASLRNRYATQMQIRVLDHVPAMSLAVVDEGLPEARTFVEFYTYESSSNARPHLELKPATSPVWYVYFTNQFEKMWQRATNY